MHRRGTSKEAEKPARRLWQKMRHEAVGPLISTAAVEVMRSGFILVYFQAMANVIG